MIWSGPADSFVTTDVHLSQHSSAAWPGSTHMIEKTLNGAILARGHLWTFRVKAWWRVERAERSPGWTGGYGLDRLAPESRERHACSLEALHRGCPGWSTLYRYQDCSV